MITVMTNTENDLCLRRLKAKQRQEWREHISALQVAGQLPERTYIKYNEAKDAYEWVLNTAENALPALKSVAEKRGYPATWVEDVKHSPLGKEMWKSLVKNMQEHPLSLAMKKSGVATRNSKRSLVQAATISSALNTLSEQVNVFHKLSDLEERVSLLENCVLTLAAQTTVNTSTLDTLTSQVSELSKTQLKHLVQDLHAEGLTPTEISHKLGKPRTTITRWLKC